MRRTYAWLGGQHDNIGDSVLRREYARCLAGASPLVVWAGRDRPGYVDGLALRDTDRLARRFRGWVGGMFVDALRGRAHVALNAGEFQLTKRYFARTLLILPVLVLVRIRGGSLVWLGAAVPQPHRGFGWLFRAVARLADDVRWRDSASSAHLLEAPTMPDWAFASGSPTPSDAGARPLLALALRGDRPPPTAAWCDAVRAAADRLGVELVMVVQVERDAARAEELAGVLGAAVLGWQHDGHGQQEALVRATYRRSVAVVSDRLHALIIGMTEGAVPLGWCETATVKLARNFEVVGLHGLVTGGTDRLEALDRDRVAALRTCSSGGLVAIRARLGEVAAETGRLLADDRPPRHRPEVADADD